MHRLSLSLPAFVAGIGVALLPLLAIPFLGVTAEDQKGPLVGLIVGMAFLAWAVIIFFSRNALLSRPPIGLSLVGVPLVAVASVSALVNGAAVVVWFGEAVEWGTVASYALFALLIVLGSWVPAKAAQRALYIYVGGAVLAGVVSVLLSVMGGDSGALSNWPTIAAALVGALVAACALADWSEQWRDREWVLVLAGAVLFVCVLMFFLTVHVAVAAAALFLFVVARTILVSLGRASRLPLMSLLVLLGLVTSIALGVRDPVLSVKPDLRPSIEATRLVSGPVFAGALSKVFVGVGPEGFGQAWNKYRPVEFNQTPLWNTTFREGNSTAATILVELGVVGVGAWLLPLVALGVLWVRRARSMSATLVASSSVVLMYYVVSFVYTTGFVAAMLCGVLIGFTVQALRRAPDSVLVLRLPVRLIAASVCVAIGVGFIFVSSLQLISLRYGAIGIERFEAGQYTAAHDALSAGAARWPTPRVYANDANVLLTILRETAASSTPPIDAVNAPAHVANRAISLDRNDLNVALTRASVYLVLVSTLKIADAESQAISSIGHAANLAPNRPEAPYLHALLFAHLGRLGEAHTYLAKALALKSDYQPAVDLQKQLTGR